MELDDFFTKALLVLGSYDHAVEQAPRHDRYFAHTRYVTKYYKFCYEHGLGKQRNSPFPEFLVWQRELAAEARNEQRRQTDDEGGVLQLRTTDPW